MDAKIKEWRGLCGKVDSLNNDKQYAVWYKEFRISEKWFRKKLAEIYDKNYEDIKNDFERVDEVNSDGIAEIKRKIEFLGAVNFAAQEEYDALEKRYNFLLM